MTHPNLCLFALPPSRHWGESVATALGLPLSPLEERVFEDGEHKLRPLVNVRGREVFVLHSLYGEPAHGVDERDQVAPKSCDADTWMR